MRQKRRIIRKYGLWVLDLACIILTYYLATKVRYHDGARMNSRTVHYLVCVIFCMVSTVYSFLIDWNRSLLHRGKFQELMAVIKYMLMMLIAGSTIVFLLHWGVDISRQVIINFVWMNLILTYVAHLGFKKFLLRYFRGERQVSKLIVVAQKSLMEKTLHSLLDHEDSALQIVGAAYVDEGASGEESADIADSAQISDKISDDLKEVAERTDDDDAAANTTGATKSSETVAVGSDVAAENAADASRPEYMHDEILGIPVYAGFRKLTEAMVQIPFDEVLVNAPDKDMEKLQEIVDGFEDMGVDCHFVLRMPDRKESLSRMETFKGYDVVTYTMNRHSVKKLMIKRLFDIIGGIVGLVITGVLCIVLIPAIKMDSPGPVFFSQTRIGKNGRRFKIWKFRSMYQDAEARLKDLLKDNEMNGLMFKMKDDPRVTRVGGFIRRTSLDEFPQFWNVLKGDMSLVGTRPPTAKEFEQYNEHYRRRLQMTPGLTGMWQVSGRSDIEDFDEVVKLDLYYIDHWSLSLDFKILLETVGAVFTHKGAK